MAETSLPKMINDLIALQKALPVMPKDTSNPFFKSKYTSLDTITETVFPIMAKHNFAWITMPSTIDGEPSLKYQLIHSSGANIDGEMRLMAKTNDPQGQGSAITYARRYAITSVLGIVSDADDDGNAAKQAADAARNYNRDDFQPEPARDINADIDKRPYDSKALDQMKAALHDIGITTKEAAGTFYQQVLGHAPSTMADAEKVIAECANRKSLKMEEPF